MPLLGPSEKAELETLVLERLREQYDREGAASLVVPGRSVVLDARGAHIAPAPASGGSTLATTEIRTLFTALCYFAADGQTTLPRDALDALATEATSALAAQVNRIAPG